MNVNEFYSLSPDEQTEELTSMAVEALKQWDMDATNIDLIKFRENAVYKITLADQTRYALRIHRPGYHTDEEMDAEIHWMHALANYGVEVPTLIPTTDGSYFTTVSVENIPEARQVDLLEWIDAEPLGNFENGLGTDPDSIKQSFETLGSIMGRMHKQSSNWPEQKTLVRHAWDCDGLVGENPFWGRFWEMDALSAEQYELIGRLRTKLTEQLSQYDKGLEHYGFIHADLVVENVLVNNGEVRVIDFDDAGFGWYLFDLATVLYFFLDDPHYQLAYDAIIKGYRSERDLSDETLQDLPLFLGARATTYLGWVHTRKETETALELTPALIQMACDFAESYL
jgi:Ser/Thr protein kinase RdoA (MazF antagonist)